MVSTRRSAGSTGAAAPVQVELPKRGRKAQAEPACNQQTDSPVVSQQQQGGSQDASLAPELESPPVQQIHQDRTKRTSRASHATEQPAIQPLPAPAPEPMQQPPAVHTEHPAQPAATYDPWADCGDDDSDDDEDTLGEGNQGPGLRSFMDNLSASIKAAFQAKAGLPQQAAPGAIQGRSSGNGNGQQQSHAADAGQPAEELHWQPEIELPKQKASTREVLQMTVQAEKQKGLAKQLTIAPQNPKEASKGSKHKGPGKMETAGKAWFDLPAQKIDDDMKRELRLLRLRGTFDPKRFYKSFDNTKFPKHFAMGTVVEGPQDYYSGRLEASQRRKTTLTDQLLADATVSHVRKKRYAKLQEEATRYQRVKKRKTDLPRQDKSHHRPKH